MQMIGGSFLIASLMNTKMWIRSFCTELEAGVARIALPRS